MRPTPRFPSTWRASAVGALVTAAVILPLLALSAPAAAAPATWWVNGNVKPNAVYDCQASMPGRGQAGPCGTIARALVKASPSDTIKIVAFKDGTPYTERLTIDKSLTLVGVDLTAGVLVPAIDGEAKGTVLTVKRGITLRIDKLKIQNGKAAFGGGILNEGLLTLENSIVADNTATSKGGGIYSGGIDKPKPAQLKLVASRVRNNKAPGGQGGGIYIGDASKAELLSDTRLRRNEAEDGGGIYVASSLRVATLALDTSSVNRNQAARNGGGVFTQGKVRLTNSDVERNKAGDDGGGLYNDQGTVDQERTSVSHNESLSRSHVQGGGGMFNHGINATLNVNRSTVSGNKGLGSSGGGIFNDEGAVNISSSTVNGNKVNESGGGIYDIKGNLIVFNSTITGNQAAGGGGLRLNESKSASINFATIVKNEATISGGGVSVTDERNQTVIRNSILAGNTARTAPDCQGPLTSGGYNVFPDKIPVPVGNVPGCTLTRPGVNNDVNPNPQFGLLIGPLRDNGGPTETMALLGKSGVDNPALRGVPGTACTDMSQPAKRLMVDQRGYSRRGVWCDIGAYERGGTPPPPPPPPPSPSPSSTPSPR